MNFVTLGDSKFIHTIRYNVSQIRDLYPESKIYIGDIGFTEDERNSLDATFIDMKKSHINETWFKHFCKPLLLMQIPGPVCYMDADAILIRKFDLEFDCDVIVTVRDLAEYGRINAGVVFLLNRKQEFISHWIRQTIVRQMQGDDLSEQRALNDIVSHYNVKEVSCDEYNYPSVEKGISDSVKIVHLKSRRRFNPKYLDIVKQYVDSL